MYSLRRPSETVIRAFLAAQSRHDFSYPAVGATRGPGSGRSLAPPRGCVLDHNRVRIGVGEDAFTRARRALSRWRMFEVGWAELLWPDAQIETGTVVALLARGAGLWTLNAARIVYTVDEFAEAEEIERFGFAYGTLPGHVARGEERFSIEWSREDNGVWYDVLAFSRPRLPARLAYPYTRALQRRFARDSLAALGRAVAD
ncbi:MAG: DUF1990 domain-containing protein [Myxococcota bacterium]